MGAEMCSCDRFESFAVHRELLQEEKKKFENDMQKQKSQAQINGIFIL